MMRIGGFKIEFDLVSLKGKESLMAITVLPLETELQSGENSEL
jgi:hypothetical protein